MPNSATNLSAGLGSLLSSLGDCLLWLLGAVIVIYTIVGLYQASQSNTCPERCGGVHKIEFQVYGFYCRCRETPKE